MPPQNGSIPPTAEEIENKLPRWVRYTLQSFALLLLVALVEQTITAVFEGIGPFKLLTEIWMESGWGGASLWVIAGIVVLAANVILTTTYSVGLLRLRRWTAVVTVFLALGSLGSVLYRLQTHAMGTSDTNGWSAPVVFFVVTLVVAVVSIAYQKQLTGSLRCLKFQIPIFIVLLPSLLFSWLSVFFVDIKSVNDSAVVPIDLPVLTAEENAYLRLVLPDEMTDQEKVSFERVKELSQALKQDEGEFDASELESVVWDTKRLTDSFIEASRLSGMQCPGYVNDHSQSERRCELNAIRDTGKLVSLRAQDSLRKGDYQDAVDSSLALISFAHHFEEVHTNFALIEYLVASAVREIGYETLEKVLAELTAAESSGLMDLSERERMVGQIQGVLLTTIPRIDAIVHSLRAEYGGLKRSLVDSLGEYPSHYFWHKNATLQSLADTTKLLIDHQIQACGSEEERLALERFAEAQVTYSEFSLPGSLLRPNVIGSLLNSAVIPALNSPKDRFCTLQQRHDELLNDPYFNRSLNGEVPQ